MMFDGHLAPHDFLLEMDRPVVRSIASATAMMVFTRRQALMKYADLP
jgi:hypothetical protein